MSSKNKSQEPDRRHFFKQAAALATLVGSAEAQSRPVQPHAGPRRFTGKQLNRISFPLGGVAAGSIGLGGRGDLRDWQIFNRPDQGNSLPYTFGALWVQAGHASPVARVLEAAFQPPFDGARGLGAANAPGLPRFESAEFHGEFPIAEVAFVDRNVPVRVQLEAFSPFLPPDAEDSGLPVAVLRYTVFNPSSFQARVSIAFAVENPVGAAGRRNEAVREPGIAAIRMSNPSLKPDDPLSGSFVLSSPHHAGQSAFTQIGWDAHSRWRTGVQAFWDHFSKIGDLPPEPRVPGFTGSIGLQSDILPGARQSFTFLLSWHFPNRTPARCGWEAPPGDENAIIGNAYCVRFPDAWAAALYSATHLERLERGTRDFLTRMRRAKIPREVREAALANISTLVTPTCFRTSDGRFYGFEGCNEQSGAWFGNCTHVWNYETVTPFLFPALSRSMRESAFGYCTGPAGKMDIRALLPAGKRHFAFSAAADGQMGQIVRLYLDWNLSGDTQWMLRHWPAAKRALEFAWIPGGWDADRDGVMEGAQHNTYDLEFYGPNPLCSIWYLAALRAAERMARAANEPQAADEYQRLAANGSIWIDSHLFNGEYYIQQVRGISEDKIAPGLLSGLGPDDTETPDLQPGHGCLADQLAGQCLAYVAGLGPLLDRKHMRRALESIYKYNFKARLGSVAAVDRVFALQDEPGLILCSYPRGVAPASRFPRFSEVWTGVEYNVAALMFFEGMHEPALEIVRAVRRRYDGERRNPWGEIEAGWHYARAMASWSCVVALGYAERK